MFSPDAHRDDPLSGQTAGGGPLARLASRPWVCPLLLAAACLHQTLYLHLYGPYGHDRFWFDLAAQMGAAQSLLDGDGLTYPAHSATSPVPQREKLSQWPPGYSVLFAAVLAPLGDPWQATFLLDTASILLFFGSWFVMIRMLRPYVSSTAALLVWSYWAFIWNPLLLLQGSNLVTVAIFSCGLACCLATAGGRRPRLAAVACGVCLGLAAALRYAYWPLILVPPLALGTAWLLTGRRRGLLEGAVLSGGVAAGLLIVLAGFNRWYLGEVAQYLGDDKQGGLQWSQLWRIDHFPARMTGFPRIWQWVSERSGLDRILHFHRASQGVSVLILVVAMLPLLTAWRARRGHASDETGRVRLMVFASAGLLTLVLTVAMLGFLSLTVPPIRFASGQLWTYLQQPRYYAPILGFLSVGLAAGVVQVLQWLRPRRILFAGLAMLLIAWLIMGLGFRGKTWVKELANYERVRTKRALENAASRAIHSAVRQQLQQGRSALFISFSPRRLYPPYIPKTPYSVRIAGGCTVNPDFLQGPIEAGIRRWPCLCSSRLAQPKAPPKAWGP
ncbi:MAG: hypothetical protein GTO03_10540 [Planctomycetales bacterium]|nr:hypothetical protein [Planctomycetales bacterium]